MPKMDDEKYREISSEFVGESARRLTELAFDAFSDPEKGEELRDQVEGLFGFVSQQLQRPGQVQGQDDIVDVEFREDE